MSNRYLGGFITATFNPLAAPVAPSTVEYLVVAGGYRIYKWTSSGSITF